MSTAQEFPYLSAVPPLGTTGTSARMALLLRARRAAERAYDAARAVPAGAAAFVRRLLAHEQLRPAAAWGRAVLNRVVGLARPLTDRFGGEGVVAAVGLLATSQTAQRLARDGADALANLLRLAAATADGLLRASGETGVRLSDLVGVWIGKTRRTISEYAKPALRLLVRTTAATEGPRAVLGGFLRGYLVHRLLRLFVRERLLRAFLSAIVLPALADGTLVRRLQQLAAQVLWRVSQLRARVERAAAQPAWAPESSSVGREHEPRDATEPKQDQQGETRAESLETEDKPQPGNRAERRAAQQQAARNRRKPHAA